MFSKALSVYAADAAAADDDEDDDAGDDAGDDADYDADDDADKETETLKWHFFKHLEAVLKN